MKFNVILTETFKKEAKILIKKYVSLRKELEELANELAENPKTGTDLGNDIYKIRLAIKSKNKGKSGGARIISYVKKVNEKVFLLTIYNKGERDNISIEDISLIIKELEE